MLGSRWNTLVLTRLRVWQLRPPDCTVICDCAERVSLSLMYSSAPYDTRRCYFMTFDLLHCSLLFQASQSCLIHYCIRVIPCVLCFSPRPFRARATTEASCSPLKSHCEVYRPHLTENSRVQHPLYPCRDTTPLSATPCPWTVALDSARCCYDSVPEHEGKPTLPEPFDYASVVAPVVVAAAVVVVAAVIRVAADIQAFALILEYAFQKLNSLWKAWHLLTRMKAETLHTDEDSVGWGRTLPDYASIVF